MTYRIIPSGIVAPVDWKTIRAHYARLFETAKLERRDTQYTIAARGGLGQNDVSRVMSNRGRGPQVETFIRAVQGLGIPVSSFFRQIEALRAEDHPKDDQSTPAKAVDVDQTATPADIKIAQLSQEIADLRQTQDRFIDIIAKATFVDFTRQTGEVEDGHRSLSGSGGGGPASRVRHKTPHRTHVRAVAATKKTVGGKS